MGSTEYLNLHNRVSSYIQWVVCMSNNICCEVLNKWYEHTPWSMVNINENAICSDYSIIADRKILANRPDVVIDNRKSKTCMLIDVSFPDDKNIAFKEAEKMSKYKDLEIEIPPDVEGENQGRPGGRRSTRDVEKRLRERSGVDRTSQGFWDSKNLLVGHCPHFTESAWTNHWWWLPVRVPTGSPLDSPLYWLESQEE